MIEIAHASPTDIDPLIGLESALFQEDSGRHDPHADPSWPAREGRKDFEDLIASPDGILLAARRAEAVVGLLAGYAARSGPTRKPIEYAVLRTMYVQHDARRLGVATLLVDRFLDWARARGCAEAHVDHYAANEAAGQLYERCGFQPRSVSRTHPL